MRRSGRWGAAVALAAATLTVAAPAAAATTAHVTRAEAAYVPAGAEDPAPLSTVEPSASSGPAGEPRPAGRMAETGAGVLPWIAIGGAAALGVGAVTFATTRRRPD
ncbi:hypothetical protein [Streptomyces spectabilis]|uniref:LPXTG cell wall anchor domain-containing protein n=1 Tax=Streptomyces spectabilis TaxID=68270 RepID=A0A7W8ARX8_STRST|nr:hypothetical protein [Streptomyces spectabilis]MBB5103524.1 hypothetical protein [Streptomyces spectabilis]MCI3904230.1 hypothetical protein [Streptomyces spectabilis]